MKIVLDRLPLPPSENNCYPTNRKTGRRFPSRELGEFQEAMKAWRVQNIRIVNQARSLLVATNPTQQKPIRVDRYFAFNHKRLWALSGAAKKLDASNRVKPMDDALCEHVLGMDDCWIWSGKSEKLSSHDEECCILVLSLFEPTTLGHARAGDEMDYPMVLTW